ncbi:MAG TPA: DEAD/DEAH box helicase [Propionicimonas sp.]|nr:DEAD/DEAH box helicase [Propionicimonas sp.]
MTTFADLGVAPDLVTVLARHDIVEPFGIQTATLPDSLAGRDVLGRGPTGSGKTVAFALPLVTRLAARNRTRRRGRPAGLVLVPTRELAVQVERTVHFLAKAVGLRTMTVYGGVGYPGQLKNLAAGVDIVIATPGRLEDLIERGACDLSDVQVTVLDEADLMADMGFLPPVRRILDLTPKGQRLLFSATLDGDVDKLVKKYLEAPVTHSVEPPKERPAEHMVFLITRENRQAVLVDLLSGAGRSLVFARTKRGVAKLASDLSRAGVPALELHGDLNQSMRQRNLSAFSDGRVRVLVATDIAARGIHVDDVALVVHSDPPAEPKAFLHRSGRTARAGASGIVVTLCQQDQNRKVRAMMAAAGIGNARREVVSPGGDLIAEVRGERAAPQAYIPEPVVDRRFDPKRPRHAQGQRGGRPFGNARGATKARAQLGTGAWGKPARGGTDTPKARRGGR